MKKISFTFIVLCILFSCNSPRNNGSNIANMYNESIESFISSKEKAFDDFIDNFEDYKFSTRVEARNEIESRIDRLVSKYENDKASADYAYEKAARECASDWEKYNKFKTEFDRCLNTNINVDKILKEAYYNPNVDRLIYTIIPEKPSKEKVERDLVGHVIYGDEYVDIKWLVAKGEIKELEILSVNKEKDDYIYGIRLVVQENGGALEGKIEVRYELGNYDDWTIRSVYTESLDYVITGKYNGYIEAKIHDGFNAGLYITNNSDVPLAVGGKALHKYGGWRKFYKVIAGNTTDIVMYSTLLSYEIDFVELPH